MPKANPLTQGLKKRPGENRSIDGISSSTRNGPPSRSGRVLIGGHFAPEVQTALKIIAAQERTTVQALLEEAIDTVFAKRHKPEIAAITPPFD